MTPTLGELPRAAQTLLHAFGWRGLARRIGYAAGLRTGWLRHRTPTLDDFESLAPARWSFRFDIDEIKKCYDEMLDRDAVADRVVERAERVLTGELELYGWAWKEVGWPPRWHTNPFSGATYPRVHWSRISDDDPDADDIKDVWELSRLPFTYVFARAYALTGQGRWPEAWWQALEDWAQHNPPNVGVNWRCGQETSLRAIAIQFGLAAFGGHPSSTSGRVALAERILAASVARVRPAVRYALSQRNNHAVSELVFLLSMRPGEPTLLRHLQEVLDDQFYDDGSYSQQSFTYQRLAVHGLLWFRRTRPDLPTGVTRRIDDVMARSRDFLARCIDPVSGWMPNYGPNDGAQLFDLSNAARRDFRPLLGTLASGAPHRTESAIWLAPDAPTTDGASAEAPPSTYVTMRGPRSRLLMRVGTGRHRTPHHDQLAIDLWIDGHNVVRDPGTYRYTAPSPWGNALTSAAVHSGPVVEGQAFRIGRFLNVEPVPAELLAHRSTGDTEVVAARRRARAGELLRIIVRQADRYCVIDVSRGVLAIIRWNLDPSSPVDVRVHESRTARELEPSERDPASGWVSDHYAQRMPCQALELPVRVNEVRVVEFGQPIELEVLALTLEGLGPVDLESTLRGFRQISSS